MASKATRQIFTICLAILWLAVVGLAGYLAITRYEIYGYAAYIVPALALFMLLIFALAFLPKSVSATPLGKRLGHLATGALILLVLIVLGVEVVRSWHKPFNALVLGFFFLALLGIFRDWLRSYLHPKPPRQRRQARVKDAASAVKEDNN